MRCDAMRRLVSVWFGLVRFDAEKKWRNRPRGVRPGSTCGHKKLLYTTLQYNTLLLNHSY
eukprot:jgi/Psemu1/308377/fgenesh1_kg.405_\